MDTPVFEELIANIYDAALGTTDWAKPLAELARAIEATSVGLMLLPDGRRASCTIPYNEDPESQRDYLERWASEDPFIPRGLRSPAGWCGPLFELAPPEELRNLRVYHEYIVPWKSGPHLGAKLLHDADGAIALLTSTRAWHGETTREQQALLARLVPHLQRAVRMRQKLEASHSTVHGLLDALAGRRLAAFVVDASLKIQHVNDEGRRLIARGDGLVDGRGELRAADARRTAELRRAVRDVLSPLDDDDVPPFLLLRRPSGEPSLHVTVSRLPAEGTLAALSKPRALLVISQPSELRTPTPQQLVSTFGLTPAESRLAVAVVENASLSAAADELGISTNTAKTQLRSVFAKTSTSRQVELARLLAALPPKPPWGDG